RGYAEVLRRRGDLSDALTLTEAARERFEALSYPIGVAYAVKTASEVRLAMGHVEAAVDTARQAVRIFAGIMKPRGLAYALKTLADAENAAGEMDAANRHYLRSIGLFDALGIFPASEYRGDLAVNQLGRRSYHLPSSLRP